MKKSITKQQLKKMESLSKKAFETSRELNQLSAEISDEETEVVESLDSWAVTADELGKELSSIVRENYILLCK